MQQFPVRALFALALTIAGGFAIAQSGTDGASTTRSQVRVSQLFGWQPLDADHLLLWTGKEEVWQLVLSPACTSLLHTRNITVTADSRHIKSGRDQVQTGKEACIIREFTLPDAALRKRYQTPRKRYQAELQASEPGAVKTPVNGDASGGK